MRHKEKLKTFSFLRKLSFSSLKIGCASFSTAITTAKWEERWYWQIQYLHWMCTLRGYELQVSRVYIASQHQQKILEWLELILFPYLVGVGNSDRDAKADSSGSWWEHQKVAGDASKQRRWWVVMHLLALKESDEITNFLQAKRKRHGYISICTRWLKDR